MDRHFTDIDDFLKTIHELEKEIIKLVQKTNLTEDEKRYIFEHIMVIPGKLDENTCVKPG